MKASELIKKLQDSMSKHGDLEVTYSTFDKDDEQGAYAEFEIRTVGFTESKNVRNFYLSSF